MVLLLATILPFRDIHIISIIHLKRLVIWSLLGYIAIQQFANLRIFFSRALARFSQVAALFLGATIVSLIKTASELYATDFITPTLVKATILSDALSALEGLLILYIMYYLVETLQQIQRLVDVIIAVSAMIALLGILQYVIGGPPPIVGFLFDQEYQFYGRATSVFSNPNELGGFSAPMVMIAFVSLIWETTSIRKRLFFILPALVLNTLALFVSFSRGAMLQIFFGMLVMSYVYYVKIWNKRLSWKVIFVVVITLGLIFSAVRYYDFYMRSRLSSYQGNDYYAALQWIKATSDFQRKNNIVQALQTFSAHPFIGIGYNLFAGKKIAGFEYFGLSPHNQYLKILTEMGLFGFIPFMILLGLIVSTGMKIWSKSRERQVGRDVQIMMLLLLSGACTITFGYLFADTLAFLPISGYLWMFSGVIFALDRQYKET